MDTQQYSLSWNHFHSNLSSGFQSLLKAQSLVDVTVAVDGRYLQAHKLVLSICSPYFRELFQVNPCKHPIVVLQDVQYKIFKSLLHFMYRGEVKVSQNDLAAFMKIAEVLKVKGLTEHEATNELPVDAQPKTEQTNTKTEQSTSNGFIPQLTKEEQLLASKPRAIRPKILRAPPPMQVASPKSSSGSGGGGGGPPKKAKLESSSVVNEEMMQLQVEAANWEREKQVQREKEHRRKDRHKERVPPRPDEAEILPLLMQCKEEPIDSEYYQDEAGQYGNDFDVGSFMSTTLEEGPEGSESQFQNDLTDTSTPGRVMLLKSRKGLPVLIHNGHIYTKHMDVEQRRSKWLCVKQRILKCEGCLTISNHDLVVVSYSGHNHTQLHDIIKRLQTNGGGSNGSSSCNSSPNHEFHMETATDLSVSHS